MSFKLPVQIIRVFWLAAEFIDFRRRGEDPGHLLFNRSAASMEFMDLILKCTDCGDDFVFSAGEQLFFREREFQNTPKRCKRCRAKRSSKNVRIRTETETTCSECGTQTTVPFKPTQGRPVLCRSCFQKSSNRSILSFAEQ
jgi:CxxC-x17-CxxC domain-containing protein